MLIDVSKGVWSIDRKEAPGRVLLRGGSCPRLMAMVTLRSTPSNICGVVEPIEILEDPEYAFENRLLMVWEFNAQTLGSLREDSGRRIKFHYRYEGTSRIEDNVPHVDNLAVVNDSYHVKMVLRFIDEGERWRLWVQAASYGPAESALPMEIDLDGWTPYKTRPEDTPSRFDRSNILEAE